MSFLSYAAGQDSEPRCLGTSSLVSNPAGPLFAGCYSLLAIEGIDAGTLEGAPGGRTLLVITCGCRT